MLEEEELSSSSRENSTTHHDHHQQTIISLEKKDNGLLKSFIYGFLIRILVILYSIWHDNTFEVKYTDVDYQVFSDAAQFVVEGESPFKRGTYRYTPLLSFMMIPNILIHPIFGKLCFCAVDLIVSWIVYQLLNTNYKRFYSKMKENNFSLLLTNCTVLFNPILINVSTRGNADQCIVLLVLLSLYAIEKRRLLESSIWFGLAVHFKIYPIIYLPTILIYLWYCPDYSILPIKGKIKICIMYCFISGTVCVSLIGIFYYFYGFEFLYESYLYHAVRSDNRHNFSIYFYYLYLGGANGADKGSRIISLLAFLPQFISLLALSWKTDKKNLYNTIFTQTFIFVIFNKVCTVQYFVWYISLFGFSLQGYFYERMKNSTRSLHVLLVLIVLWFVGQGIWLSNAYKLEFLGENYFFAIWLSGLVFFIINTCIALIFRPTTTSSTDI